MDMNAKRGLLLLLLACAILLFSGCRERITPSSQEAAVPGDSGAAQASVSDAPAEEGAPEALPAEAEADAEQEENDEPGARTQENPDASRKEYDEHAPAEILAGTEHLLHEEGEGNGTPLAGEDAGAIVHRVNDRAEESALQTVPAREAEETGVSEDAEAADSALTYFTVLLRDRTESLFECQRLSLYWETPLELVTVHKTAPEHSLILNAGTFDVSARLLPENLQVDSDWVVRKNPGIIVKVVDGDVLGSGVHSTAAARSLQQRIMSRKGWGAIDAVKNKRVLLLSGELLEAPHLQLAALLLIAGTAYPGQFRDVDPNEALTMLTEEAAGALPGGILYYSGQEEGI